MGWWALATAACGATPPATPEPVCPLAETAWSGTVSPVSPLPGGEDAGGLWDAGVTTFELARPDGTPFRVEVWYPARRPAGDAPAFYDDFPLERDVGRDAPAARGEGPFPLVAFSHGLGGVRYQSASLVEHLARQGFVVVAPDHPGSILLEVDTDPAVAILPRPEDVRAAVDEVQRRSMADEGALGCMLAGPGYAMTGHSLGAVTTLFVSGATPDLDGLLALCETERPTVCRFVDGLDPTGIDVASLSDPRVVASVPLSPGGAYMFGTDGAGLAAMPPTLVWAGEEDTLLGFEDESVPVYDALESPRFFGGLADAGHYVAFSDLCDLLPLFPDCGGPEAGYLDGDVARAVVNTLTAAFLHRALREDRAMDAWLAEPELPEDQAEPLTWTADPGPWAP
jgi:predicted dienelactone hydrolase